MIEMAAQRLEHAATQTMYAGSSVAAAGGMWAWLGDHYQAIGALAALGGLCIAGIGLIASLYYQHRQTRAIERRHK